MAVICLASLQNRHEFGGTKSSSGKPQQGHLHKHDGYEITEGIINK